MRWPKIRLTDLVHFALGFAAAKMGLETPIAIVFTAYEFGDLLREIEAWKLEGEVDRGAYMEYVVRILRAKYELRKDLGAFILGLLLGALF